MAQQNEDISVENLVRIPKESFKLKGLRKHLVDLLQNKGVKDKNVLCAISNIPRHLFIEKSFKEHAYQDKAFPIESGQTISNPFTVALQSELLELKKGDKVLEIGTGSGYQCAVLVYMGAEVYSIERQETLYKKTKFLLSKLNYYPKQLIYGDGYNGLEMHADYDGIIVTAGAPFVPKPLLSQLKVGGKLVIPLGDSTQQMTVFKRESEKKFQRKTFGDFRFVPMLKNLQQI